MHTLQITKVLSDYQGPIEIHGVLKDGASNEIPVKIETMNTGDVYVASEKTGTIWPVLSPTTKEHLKIVSNGQEIELGNPIPLDNIVVP